MYVYCESAEPPPDRIVLDRDEVVQGCVVNQYIYGAEYLPGHLYQPGATLLPGYVCLDS